MDDQVLEARLRMLVRQWPIVWGGNLAVQAICVVMFWPYFPKTEIVLWFLANLVLFSYRLRMRRRFESCVREGREALERWARAYVVSAVVGGLIWGGASWMFFDSADSVTTQILLLVLIGMVVGALPALSSYSPAFIAFMSGIMLPTIWRLFVLDGQFAHGLAILGLISFATNLFYCRRLDRTISESITADLRSRRLLEDVTEARTLAERANRSKSDFLATVSHDLRQPLHAMGLFLASLGRQVETSRQRETLGHVQTAHDSLTEMFDALLEISRLDSGTVEPIYSDFPLRPLLRDLENNFAPLARQKGLSLEIGDSPAIIRSDRILVFGMLGNLLSNALKYTDRGRVGLSCCERDGRVVVRIEDTGCGIPVEDQQRIFETYTQLDNPERDRSRGLGLGLAMVRRTANLLGIDVELASRPGVGSAFSLILPEGMDRMAPSSSRPRPAQDELRGLHVLLVDDDPEIRLGMVRLLVEWGCLVTHGASRTEALQALGRHSRPPDVLVCDYRLGGGETGLDAVAGIRTSLDPELPALIVTGETSPELESVFQRAGLETLRKPIRPDRLKGAIMGLVGWSARLSV